jgi:hypothetical protein
MTIQARTHRTHRLSLAGTISLGMAALLTGACTSGSGDSSSSIDTDAPGASFSVGGDTSPFTITGPEGGPFPEGSRTYTLTNSSPTRAIEWHVEAGTPWLSFSEPGGLLGPGVSTNVVVSLVADLADGLPPGEYPRDIVFRDARDLGADYEIFLAFLLRVLPSPDGDTLSVSPESDLTVTGQTDGDLDTTEVTYTLENQGKKTIEWLLSVDQNWMQLPDEWAGSLGPGEQENVVLGLDPAATSYLAAGTYRGMARFDVTSGTPGSGLERFVDLVLSDGENSEGRVEEGLIALYDFEQPGTIVPDVSGIGTALDLTIENPGAVEWLPGLLRISQATRLVTSGPAEKVVAACTNTDEVTVEAWITPKNLTQDGPARIATISNGSYDRDVTLGQGLWGGSPSDTYNVRLRSTHTDQDGMPLVTTAGGTAQLALQHVIYTRDTSGRACIYVDGDLQVEETVGGNLSNWDGTYRLALANELDTSRPWLGDMHLVAVYGRELSSDEVRQNYEFGSGDAKTGQLVVDPPDPFVITGTEGESFSTEETVYTLSNPGPEPIQWSSVISEPWIYVDFQGGSLEPEEERLVTVHLDLDQVLTFDPGYYGAFVEFTNESNGIGSTKRLVHLTIKSEGGDGGDINFFVDANSGSDSNSGMAGHPWKTLAKALSSAAPGSTIGVHEGHYGEVSESASPGRAEYLTFKAMPGSRPEISKVHIGYPSMGNAYLRFEGFEVYGYGTNLVFLRNARHVQFIDCEVHAQKWAQNGNGIDSFEILYCSDVLIERTRMYETFRGVTMTGTADITLRRNYITVKAGTPVNYTGGCSNGLVEYNHLEGEAYVGYPSDSDAVQGPHASVIAVRSGDLIIRGNHMHGMGNSSGIMFYKPDVAGGEQAYSNILLENNALYDIDNTYALRINNLGSNVVVRNNLIYPKYRTGDCNGITLDARYRYSNAIIVHSMGPGHDGSGLELYNNILLGTVSVPAKVQERNNIAWSWGPSPWMSTSPSGTSLIITSMFEGCGNHSSFFVGGFFEQTPDLAFPNKAPANWTLAKQSIGVNFGDPSVQAFESLGAIGPDGFLLNNGQQRSGTVHSVGPYERDPAWN